MEKWKPRILITETEKQKILFFSRMFNIHPIVIFLIYARGHHTQESIRSFLYPSFNYFSTPFLLTDLEKGVNRVTNAIKNDEKIGIFGDYDVDGITSTSMMMKAISSIGGNCVPKIPFRSNGYGLTKEAVNEFKHENISLILTLDNGSSCYDEILYAKQLGIDTIILDHHDILRKYPPAYAFINPKRKDDTSGLTYLSGAGVTFKFIEALYENFFLPWNIYMHDFIELATLSTICDMVPLVKENRLICHIGMKKMNQNPSFCIKALKEMLKIKTINSNSISFTIGPLINGFGRYDNPNLLLPFLGNGEWNDWIEQKCRSVNQLRKKLSQQQTLLAEDILYENNLDSNDVIHIHGDFHEGIIGILASKFSKKYKKPTLVSCFDGKGSARSIPNSSFSIIELLNQYEPFFEKYGGHQQAAGFTLKKHSIEEFHQEVSSYLLDTAYLHPTVEYDMELDISKFPVQLFEDLSFMEPFGIQNPKPVFRCRGISFPKVECFGKNDTHIKCIFGSLQFYSFFAGSEEISLLTYHPCDLLYSPLDVKEFTIESLRTNEETPFPFVI